MMERKLIIPRHNQALKQPACDTYKSVLVAAIGDFRMVYIIACRQA